MTDLPRLSSVAGVLNGIRVVEQGTFITGPCAGMMLADLGADVIKVESPEGDPYRAYQGGHYSPHFQAYNRNKRSIALDMKRAADCEVFATLVRHASARAPSGCSSSIRSWCTAPSAASAPMVRTPRARATTRWRRL